ncbi:MAG: hypothetical protein H7333_03405 [Bdellovibrionales bacterium]|nr:hypothetical protein [Oligoflexia bacterium]
MPIVGEIPADWCIGFLKNHVVAPLPAYLQGREEVSIPIASEYAFGKRLVPEDELYVPEGDGE